MNIVILAVRYFYPHKGYLEYYLARELAKLDNDVTVFTFKHGLEISQQMIDNFRVVYIPPTLKIHCCYNFGIRAASKIIKIIEENSPEVIHCQMLFDQLPLLLMRYQHRFNYKIVGNLLTQEYLLDNIIQKIGFRLVKTLVKRYVKHKTSLFFAKTKELEELLIGVFGISPRNIHIIPLGVDPDLFKFSQKARYQIRDSLGLSDEDIVVVYSGKITPIKKLEILIEAIAPIIKENKNVNLLIIGEGEMSYLMYLKGLISRLRISKNVIFHHAVHRTLLPGFYSASDIAVWPGLSSISIVEAASTNLPVIFRATQAELYAIENKNGFVFEQGNLDRLRKYLNILVHNEDLRKEMGRRSRLLVEQKLTWKSIANRYLNSYMQISNS